MSPHQPSPTSPEQPADSVSPNPRLWSRTNMRRLYDLLVIHGSYWALWGCPWQRVAALYHGAISPGARVLEIGPGTGYVLNRLDQPDLEVHLLDVHPGPLEVSAQRLTRYRPTTYQYNALEPFPLEEGSVDVAVLSMVLHCLPGESITAKAPVFDHIAHVLPRSGVCIGATVLSHGVPLTRRGRTGLRSLNSRRVFNNRGDSLSDLSAVLHTRFDEVHLAVCGSVALWQVSTR